MTTFYKAIPGTELYKAVAGNILFYDEFYDCYSKWVDNSGMYPFDMVREQGEPATKTDLEQAYMMSRAATYELDDLLLEVYGEMCKEELANR